MMQSPLQTSLATFQLACAGASTTRVRALQYRCASTGFMALLAQRPVLYRECRAALLLLPLAGGLDAIRELAGRIDSLTIEHDDRGFSCLFVPWALRRRLEVLVVDLHEAARSKLRRQAPQPPVPQSRPAAVAAGQQPFTDTAPLAFTETLAAPSHRQDSLRGPGTHGSAPLRFSTTREGQQARRVLMALGNLQPGFLARFIRERRWVLPYGIVLRESSRSGRNWWRIDFSASGVEMSFMERLRELPAPLELRYEMDRASADGGSTEFAMLTICAPVQSKGRRVMARLLWDAVSQVWLAEQREQALPTSVY